MNSKKNLAAQVIGAVAIATLVGTSAFAETRHSDATERDRSHHSDRSSDHGSDRSSGHVDRGDRHSSDRSNGNRSQTFQRHESTVTQPSQRSDWRNPGQNYGQSYSHNNNSRGNGNVQYDRRSHVENYRDRSYDRSYGNRGNRPSFDDRGRRSYSIRGRVSRFVHERGGYRVWVDGGLYPVWIPEARINLFPHLRVGLSLGFGGYYDPAGYVEAYDYYDGGVYGGGAYSSGLLRGTVESVDYRNGTLVLRDDVSGSFVTTLIRDRRLEALRPGDYAEISGDWTRTGVFQGLRLEDSQVRAY